MGLLFCDRYEVESELEQDIFTFSDQYQIKTYKGNDRLESRSVLIRALNLSGISESLREFTHNLWNHELRITRQALAATKGKNITNLVDAKYDEGNSAFVLIFNHPGSTLKNILQDGEQAAVLFSPEQEHRREFWQAFLNIAQALHNLHQHSILHRNLSTSSIFWDTTEENFADSLSIGNFSLSIYLHSLFQQISSIGLNENDRPQKKWSIYCAPEIVGVSEPKQSFVGENFASDLFSLGIILTQCFLCEEFDNANFTSTTNYREIVELIIESVKTNSSAFLNEKERTLILKLISLNGNERYKNAGELIESIKEILMSIKFVRRASPFQ